MMNGRPWTATEIQRLTEMVGGHRFIAIAQQLGRSEKACRLKALGLGLYVTRPWADYGPRFHCFLRAKNAAGWSDAEIARAWGGERQAVGRHRRRLGLPSNAYNDRHQEKSAATQFKKGCLRGRAARRYAWLGSVKIRRDKTRRRRRWIKVREGGPTQHRYVPLARFLWERLHGPLPAGTFVVHANGNTLDDDPANLVLMDRQRLLAWQQTIRPQMKAKARRRCSEACRRRWQAYRALKVARQAKAQVA